MLTHFVGFSTDSVGTFDALGRAAAFAFIAMVLLAGCGGAALFANRGDEREPIAKYERSRIVVLVRDGDTGAVIRHARVRIRWQSKRADAHGAAAFRVPWVGGLKVRGV